ncbi:hypothetical protein K402DRAFT_3318 [Aulographum hederae CBS 113979]|uniref:Phosphoribosylaminoimidazole-succinocarboxamide synthase n=1 Tax=Aulographum hederae CBS 113979 TaxID=1176131 RepID=A0A6G1HH91_9PEZI|nr:hypothetical protein K402DRAFT_3318 [Aulographum hederae CBS 113979]
MAARALSPSLRQTNVSQPRLAHAHSSQSISADEDYYSLSDHDLHDHDLDNEHTHLDSDNESHSQRTIRRYSTPPSRIYTPQQSREQLPPHHVQPSIRHVKSASQQHLIVPNASSSVAFDERSIQRKPLPNPNSNSNFDDARKRAMDQNSGAMTPGLDDTPYIRFAIDQLTRDEEVRGSRQYHGTRPEPDYPVDRLVSDEGLGYTTRDPASVPAEPPVAAIPPRHPGRLSREYSSSPPPQPIEPLRVRKEEKTGEGRPLPDPPAVPQPQRQSQQSPRHSDESSEPDIFVPYNPLRTSTQHPPLNFLPSILRPFCLLLFILVSLLMLAGLMFCAIYSPQNDGLWAYGGFGDSRYFVFNYLPTLLGMIILIWLFQVQIAVQRMTPFMCMASNSVRSRSNGVLLDLYPTQFLVPKIQYFAAGQPVIGACFIIFWLFLFTVPLLASAFNVRFFGPQGTGVWMWVPVQGVIWTIIALYWLLIFALIALAVTLWRTRTGLKWDPRSLADLIVLIERSNFMNDYAGSETFSLKQNFKLRLYDRTDRLGYWHTSKRPQDVFHGLGEEGGVTRRYSIEQGRIKEKAPERQSFQSQAGDLESGQGVEGGNYSIRMDIRSSKIRRRYIPWFIKDTFIVAWIVVCVILYLAFLVVSFVNGAVTNGFSPALPAGSSSGGFSSANFLYSFIPALIGFLLYLLWMPIDFSHRRLQPFAALSSYTGATAERSLLLDYPARLPFSATITALLQGDLKVAYVTFITLLSASLPVLAGGIFWAQFYTSDSTVRIAAHRAGLYALCVFLAFYATAFFAILPGRKRMALPHDATTLAEIISWLYMSHLLTDRAFARCETKAQLVSRLLGAKPGANGVAGTTSASKRPNLMASLSSLTGLGNRSRAALPTTAEEVPDEGPSLATITTSVGEPEPKSLRSGSHRDSGYSKPADVMGEKLTGEAPKTRIQLAMKEVRYGFGVYVGRDGREHLGVDRVRRVGEGARDMVLFDERFGRGILK